MVGKKIGIQSTGIILLKALAGEEQDPREGTSTIIPIGADMTPLMTGQVDAVTGWLTNTTALKRARRPSASTWRCGTPA